MMDRRDFIKKTGLLGLGGIAGGLGLFALMKIDTPLVPENGTLSYYKYQTGDGRSGMVVRAAEDLKAATFVGVCVEDVVKDGWAWVQTWGPCNVKGDLAHLTG